jgi:hypothetical protein
MSRRAAGDHGTAMLEFAFVAPMVFLLFAALIDIGLVVLGGTIASGAARDGARVGVIHYVGADQAGSTSELLIQAAVRARLVGMVKPGTGTFIVARCLDGTTKVAKSCNANAIVIDSDVIEVTVNWEALSGTGAIVMSRQRTDSARMVITGGPDAPTSPDPASGSATVGFAPTAVATTEADSDTTLTLTVTRSNGTGAASVAFATANGTAIAGSDYVTQSNQVNFANLETSKTITLTIIGDNVAESSEQMTVVLSNPIGATIAAGGGTATVTIADDDAGDTTPPNLVSLVMRDGDADGKVDQLVATFNETLANSCPAPAAVTLTSAPSGATVSGVAVSGSIVTVALNEGAGVPNTAVGAFRVSLATGCVRDAAGNWSTFTNQTPADYASPVLLSVTDTNGAVDGKAENGDTITFGFSEAIAVPPTTSDVSITQGATGDLSVSGLISTTALGADYAAKDLTFNGSTVAASGANLTVTLANCNTTGQCSSRALAGTSSSITFTALGTLVDAAGRGAVGAVTKTTFKLF